jgi:hypothetical protein
MVGPKVMVGGVRSILEGQKKFCVIIWVRLRYIQFKWNGLLILPKMREMLERSLPYSTFRARKL